MLRVEFNDPSDPDPISQIRTYLTFTAQYQGDPYLREHWNHLQSLMQSIGIDPIVVEGFRDNSNETWLERLTKQIKGTSDKGHKRSITWIEDVVIPGPNNTIYIAQKRDPKSGTANTKENKELVRNFLEKNGYKDIIDIDIGSAGGDIKYDHTRGVWFLAAKNKDLAQRNAQALQEKSGVPVIPIVRTKPEYYHLDTFFTVLPQGELLVYPDAMDKESLALVKSFFAPEDIIEIKDAFNPEKGGLGRTDVQTGRQYIANSIYGYKDGQYGVLLPYSAPKIEEELKSRGYKVVSPASVLDNFMKCEIKTDLSEANIKRLQNVMEKLDTNFSHIITDKKFETLKGFLSENDFSVSRDDDKLTITDCKNSDSYFEIKISQTDYGLVMDDNVYTGWLKEDLDNILKHIQDPLNGSLEDISAESYFDYKITEDDNLQIRFNEINPSFLLSDGGPECYTLETNLPKSPQQIILEYLQQQQKKITLEGEENIDWEKLSKIANEAGFCLTMDNNEVLFTYPNGLKQALRINDNIQDSYFEQAINERESIDRPIQKLDHIPIP